MTLRLVLGLIIGAVFVDVAPLDRGWRWVFWNLAMVALPTGLLSVILIPAQEPVVVSRRLPKSMWKRFDLVGVSVLTSMSVCLECIHLLM